MWHILQSCPALPPDQPKRRSLQGDLIRYQASTRLRQHGYLRALVPDIVHQHSLVLRVE